MGSKVNCQVNTTNKPESIATPPRVMIIDNDKPGYIKMKSYQKVAHINDEVVRLELVRMKGADG